ncbi:MAG: LysE family translocator [Acidaminococcaceae bacterium]
MTILFNGFKFGLLLQLAVGPLCLMTFNLALTEGFFKAVVFASSVTLVDALYISLACVGLAETIKKSKLTPWLNYAGSFILIFLGGNLLISAVTTAGSSLPFLSPFGTPYKIFAQGFMLTVTNPLTVIFWGSIFSLQIVEKKLSDTQLRLFAAGCILSSTFFLTIIACLGSLATPFFSPIIIISLNSIVACFLIYCGIKSLIYR